MTHRNGYMPIEDHGIIGNMHTAALVSSDARMNFLCFPKFDSPSVFASLLHKEDGGSFDIIPKMNGFKTKQLYIPGTAVLITRFFSDEGIVEVTDYMPVNRSKDYKFNAVVRKIKCIRGEIQFDIACKPRFNYATAKHTAKHKDGHILFRSEESKNTLRLSSTAKLTKKQHDGYASFTLKESEKQIFVLEATTDDASNGFEDIESYGSANYFQTINFWRRWLKKSTYNGRWKEIIERSVITLKLLTSIEYGSIIAAATFGLPEEIGGERNWDYRYTWIRDAAFTVYAFLKLGFTQEARDFLQWIVAQDKSNELQLLYRIDGSSEMTEEILSHFSGYMDSKPVRIGNEAKNQLQLDIYGELLDTIYLSNELDKPITYELWEIIQKEIKVVEKRWRDPDHGIWEIRNEKHEFLHSRLMCWVAVDRAIKIAEFRSFPYDAKKWHTLRNDIFEDIYHNFWNEDLQAWVQFKDVKKLSSTMDASVLLMPLVHFVVPDEPRWISTMKAVDEQLRVDVLVYRYENKDKLDGLEGEEGTFTMCSFWYIECLAKMGRLDEAVENFEKMLGYGNHLGLFAEMIGKKGEHLGNFPQAFTHLALISTALELNKQISRL